MRRTNFLLLLVFHVLFLLSACSEKRQPEKRLTNENWLLVSGDQIINQKGDTVYLRGFGLGGMLHMENFIDGYPANEEAVREGLLKVLGEKRYNLFFDTFLKSYFTESDAEYIHSLGLNLIRIPVNYSFFEKGH